MSDSEFQKNPKICLIWKANHISKKKSGQAESCKKSGKTQIQRWRHLPIMISEIGFVPLAKELSILQQNGGNMICSP